MHMRQVRDSEQQSCDSAAHRAIETKTEQEVVSQAVNVQYRLQCVINKQYSFLIPRKVMAVVSKLLEEWWGLAPK